MEEKVGGIQMSKMIKIDICNDDGINCCPFFKRVGHWDYDDDCLCIYTEEERHIPQYIYIKQKDGFNKLSKFVSGEIPKWCPLGNYKEVL